MNGDVARNVTFSKGKYDAYQVNALLDHIAAELDAGRPAGPLIANATLRTTQSRFPGRGQGYDQGAVEWFLERLRRREDPAEAARMNADPWRSLDADPYCSHRLPGNLGRRVAAPSPQECADAWRDFGQQPGTRLSWVTTGALRGQLRIAEQQTLASCRAGWTSPKLTTLTASGRTFTWRRVSRSSWPGIAETISHGQPSATARILNPQTDDIDLLLRQLLDETGTPVLYTAGKHIDRGASGYIKFPGQRWLRFPVRGDNRANAIMTAIDQAGNKVARYRLASYWNSWKIVEITVHPGQQLTDELALAIALSAPWLRSYFRSSGGGGG